MVRDHEEEDWNPRVFAGVEAPWALAYSCEYHPWSNNDSNIVRWNYCRKPTKEELAEAGISSK